MLKKLFYKVLCVLCFGFAEAKTEIKNNDKPVAIITSKDGRKVKVYSSQLLKILINKVQTLKKEPKPEDMEKLFKESRQELAALYALYLKNKSALLKDKDFLKQVLFSAVLLNRERLAAEASAKIPEADIKKELDKFVEQIPVPMVYRTKVIVLNSAEEAQRAISGLESGAEFSSLAQASIKKGEFENGKVIDKKTGREYITVYSDALPEAVRATLQQYNKPTKRVIVKNPIAVKEDDKITYWVVMLEEAKKGSKKDLPAIDLKDERLRNTISMVIANNTLIDEGDKALKAMKVEMFKPDGSAES